MINDLRSFLSTSSIVEINDELLERRLSAIEKFLDHKPLSKKCVNLIKFIYSLETETNSVEEFRQVLIDQDPEFPKQGKVLELKILSFFTLYHLIQTRPAYITTPIVLALVNCFGFGLRDKFPRLGVEEISNKLLQKQVLDRRNFNPLETVTLNHIMTKLESIAPKELPSDVNEASKKLSELFEGFAKNIRALTETLNANFYNINRKEAILKDDANVLWWLFSKNSKTLQKPWKEIKEIEAYILVGKELGDQITLPPGPPSYDQIMKNIIENNLKGTIKNVTLQKIISSISKELKKEIINSLESYIDEVAPVHYLIMCSLEKKTGSNFNTKVKSSKINIKRPLPSIDFAVQMYRERMYIKSMQKLGE